MCIIYSSYIQHLTNKHKERQTTEKSTVGSEAQRRWELFECKWVPMSAPHSRSHRCSESVWTLPRGEGRVRGELPRPILLDRSPETLSAKDFDFDPSAQKYGTNAKTSWCQSSCTSLLLCPIGRRHPPTARLSPGFRPAVRSRCGLLKHER